MMSQETCLTHICVTAILPGTCGELVQGTLDGVPCLVSCPIDRYSIAHIELCPDPNWSVPHDAPKAAAALRAGLIYLGQTSWGGRLELDSDLPRGRGYASSTADVAATLYALGEAVGRKLTDTEVARLAVGVEPSDSTIFPGLTLFDHRQGSFHEWWGDPPSAVVVVCDPGGEVDTLHFNRQDYVHALRLLVPWHREAFDLLRQGLQLGDLPTIGEAATISAQAHQVVLPSVLLNRVLPLAREVGGVGVCRAHSGTISGILLDPCTADISAVVAFLRRSLGESIAVRAHRLVGGGPRMGEEKIATQ